MEIYKKEITWNFLQMKPLIYFLIASYKSVENDASLLDLVDSLKFIKEIRVSLNSSFKLIKGSCQSSFQVMSFFKVFKSSKKLRVR